MKNKMKNKMKNVIKCLILTIFLTGTVIAQDKQDIKPGYYAGKITENGNDRAYILEFSNDGYAYQCELKNYGEPNVNISRSSYPFKQTSSHSNITTLEWINSGGIWTETQFFICTKVNQESIEVLHIRYVTNEGSEGESWYYGGKTIFYLFELDDLK